MQVAYYTPILGHVFVPFFSQAIEDTFHDRNPELVFKYRGGLGLVYAYSHLVGSTSSEPLSHFDFWAYQNNPENSVQ